MTADDHTETQWGVRYPDGRIANGGYLKAWAFDAAQGVNRSLRVAGSTERAVVVTRTRTITYTEWTEDA